jgi:formate hydrogenlyase subunit 3/multisubunit Na+/H+ antiporter MnhD subunit
MDINTKSKQLIAECVLQLVSFSVFLYFAITTRRFFKVIFEKYKQAEGQTRQSVENDKLIVAMIVLIFLSITYMLVVKFPYDLYLIISQDTPNHTLDLVMSVSETNLFHIP